MASAALVVSIVAATASLAAVWIAAVQARAARRATEASERSAVASERAAQAAERVAALDEERRAVERRNEAEVARAKSEAELRLSTVARNNGRRLVVSNVSSAKATHLTAEPVAAVGADRVPPFPVLACDGLAAGESVLGEYYHPTFGWPRQLQFRVTWTDGRGRQEQRVDVDVLRD